jgi:hypothetical protein|tara:strand:+ start:622 stop:2643 length:2022 start_codon:yes stop_codon:yes gene_type:complete
MGVKDCIDCNKKKAVIDCNCIPVENADGTLVAVVLGCTDSTAVNYNALANCDDGSCIELIAGCMDPASSNLNYSACYNADCAGNIPGSAAYIAAGTYGDVSCCCSVSGCTDDGASNYNASACLDDGSCSYPGCMDPIACNYDPSATVSNGSCTYPLTASVTQVSCDSYYWALSGQTYNASGVYPYTASGACPTTTTLNLTINNATSNSETRSECISYTWPVNGTNYTASGTYTYTGTNGQGCTNIETLNLSIDPSGCTDATATNYNSSAVCDDGSCIAAVGGCTYGGGSLPSWSSAIGDGGPNTSSTWATLYGISDPGIASPDYNASANVEDGSCTFCVYGCTDVFACNYDSTATCEATTGNPGSGVCTPPASMDLGSTTNGVNDPNSIDADGKGAGSFDCCDNCPTASPHASNVEQYGIGCFPYTGVGVGPNLYTGTTAQHYGGHANKGISGSFALDDLPSAGGNNTGTIRTESYFFILGDSGTPLIPTQTYCITWAQIVLKLNGKDGGGVCSDCLMGGWGVLLDNVWSYDSSNRPGYTDMNSSTNTSIVSIYDPVNTNDLTVASSNYDNVNGQPCGVNAVGNPGGLNTAGASNGSHSQWESKCITFTATQAQHTVHFYAITDFDSCLGCTYPNNGIPYTGGVRGTYVGISNVNIDTSCTGGGSCSCTTLGF